MALSEPKKTRDLSIEVASYRLAVLRDREVDFASLQPRCRTEVWDGGYAVLMDEKPLAIVTLHSDTRFTVDVAENVVRRTLRISGPARYALISKPTRPPAPLHAIVTSR